MPTCFVVTAGGHGTHSGAGHRDVEDFIVATRAMAVSNSHWICRGHACDLRAAAGIAFYLVLVHPPELLKYVQR